MKRRTLLTAPLIGAAAGALTLGSPAAAATYKLVLTLQKQERNYWCGPAAMRMAISADHSPPSQSSIASRLGTTTGGTNRHQMLSGANYYFGTGTYGLEDVQSRGGLKSSVSLREQFWNRLVNGTSNGVAPIVNVVVQPGSPYRPPGWTNTSEVDHWFVVYGVETTSRIVYIGDPASGWPGFNANNTYGMRFDYLCQLVMKAYLYF
jgi:hypothetical protein